MIRYDESPARIPALGGVCVYINLREAHAFYPVMMIRLDSLRPSVRAYTCRRHTARSAHAEIELCARFFLRICALYTPAAVRVCCKSIASAVGEDE